MNKYGWVDCNCNSVTSVRNTATSARSSQCRYFAIASKKCKSGYTLKAKQHQIEPYEAASAQLVWTAHVYGTLSTNRIKHCSLPCFDVPTTNGSVHTTHEAIASGWYTVHTMRFYLSILCIALNILKINSKIASIFLSNFKCTTAGQKILSLPPQKSKSAGKNWKKVYWTPQEKHYSLCSRPCDVNVYWGALRGFPCRCDKTWCPHSS